MTPKVIAVPTPLITNTAQIDTSIIQNALKTISDHVRPGATIVVESSVSVGMTRSLLGKMVETHNLHAGMSPERVDPGRTDPSYESIPKIISGLNQASLESITKLYSPVFQSLVPVSSPEVAEMTKLYENCQRMMCIAYANEMADACYALPSPIDPFEVSRAAATKPFGYLPFTPSAGVGGHCIPVNPSYLFSTGDYPLLKHATEKMKMRPAMLADRTMKALTTRNKSATPKNGEQKFQVLVVGVAFKPGQELTTNSPGLGIINHLLDTWDAHVVYADPLVKESSLHYVPRLDEKQEWNKERLQQFDAIIVVMKQKGLDFGVLEGLEGVLLEQHCN
ncbi:hypothetical protein HYFRA_00006498 [Hymenoscyphus fraxineus]|uniref:UDP-glucose/GDP-mannose dehydrogenase C-terminal domain-containing protein n=1 Tax=Hymenoscyphus fraxineus TaxID=746836 RepID=A0A9N9KNH6_9HELO|nr:hypothetical protein HYFRA_00006498 [Hymenoscyphus fraxineus]